MGWWSKQEEPKEEFFKLIDCDGHEIFIRKSEVILIGMMPSGDIWFELHNASTVWPSHKDGIAKGDIKAALALVQ